MTTISTTHSPAPVTIAAALLDGTVRLEQHSESPRLDAEILLGTVVSASRSSLIIRASETLTDAALRALAATVGQEVTYTCLPPGWAN